MKHPTSSTRQRMVRLLAVAASLACGIAAAARPEFVISPAPSWVLPVPPKLDAAVPADQVSSGLNHLLVDSQNRLEGKERISFRHLATTAINQKGVENIGQIEIRFDPSYQVLALHSVIVHRAGQRIDKLKAEAVKILQREKELEYLVYDGSKTANILLDDVQTGDTVEYSYSLRGDNPVFGGMRSGRIDLQFNVPVHQIYSALDLPAGKTINVTKRNDAPEAVVSESGNMRRLSWTRRDVPALVIESDAPSAYDPAPAIEWSDFADWGAVARWAAPLYRLPEQSRAVTGIADKLASEDKTPEHLVIAALRLVQRDIRYLAVAIGSGSHAPNAPDKVLQRRFGDCKDKSLLLVAILRRLGIDAQPALVHTDTRDGVRGAQPSPNAFNHVIVRVQLGNRVLWLDPTRSAQGGKIDSVQQADFGYALVIDPATDKLTTMFPDGSKRPWERRTVSTVFDIRGGMKEPVKYSIVSTYEGRAADSIRNSMSNVSRDELQKRYSSFYETYYPGIRSTAKFTVEDFFEPNTFIVRESYEIPAFWESTPGRKVREGLIRVPDIEVLLLAPRTTQRHAPLALAHPAEMLHTTDVLLPEPWTVKPSDTRVEGPAFTYDRRIEQPRNDRIVLRDHMVSTASEVSVAALPEYTTALGKARDATDLALTRYGDGGKEDSVWEKTDGLIVTVVFAMAVAWIWLALRVYRFDPQSDTRPTDPTLNGMRGWLLVAAIPLFVFLVRWLVMLKELLPGYTTDAWSVVTDRARDVYSAVHAPLMIVELGVHVGQLIFSVVLLLLFFKRRSSFSNVYVVFMWFAVVFSTLDMLIAARLPGAEAEVNAKTWAELARSAFGAFIWTAYFKTSVRVRSTFVKTYQPRQETPALPAVAESS